MSTPFLGEIKIVSFNFPPKGWALCDGQLLPINQNQALFSLFGTMYGGNGQTTFALPDLRGRSPMHVGSGFLQGQKAGEESHTLTISEMPTHTHQVTATSDGAGSMEPAGLTWAAASDTSPYSSNAPNTTMSPSSISTVGGSQPHNNMGPYIVLNMIVALQGIFPSRN